MELLIASKNEGKVREITQVLDLPGLVLLTARELGDWTEPQETGSTLEENAIIKAASLLSNFNIPSLADDSGLEVDYLGGEPGVHSSRYAGPEGDAARNIERLLKELEGVAPVQRSARFRCVIAFAMPGDVRLTRGACEGTILNERRGSGGFGYDPVFLPSGFDSTMAELTLKEKNGISHRGHALREMREVLASYAE
jgi:XTP/dITP diphosphohydrolase